MPKGAQKAKSIKATPGVDKIPANTVITAMTAKHLLSPYALYAIPRGNGKSMQATGNVAGTTSDKSARSTNRIIILARTERLRNFSIGVPPLLL